MDTVAAGPAFATLAFAALSQPTRLEALRLLVRAGPEGLTAGTIADRLGVVSSTLSHHLAQLERAGLARARRQGRFVYYTADPDGTRRLLDCVSAACAGAACTFDAGTTPQRQR